MVDSMRGVRACVCVCVWLEKDEVVRRCNSRLARRLLRLPPSPADVRNLENLMFCETDLVRVIWVGFIRIYRFGTVGVLRRLSYLARLTADSASVGLRAEDGLETRCAGSGRVESSHGRGSFEPAERCGRVHVWMCGGESGFRTRRVAVRDGLAVAVAVWLFLVRRKRVNVRPGP